MCIQRLPLSTRDANWVWLMTSVLRGMNRLLAVIGVALLITLIIVLSVPVDTAIDATRFDRASLCSEAPIDTPFSRVGLSRLLLAAPAAVCAHTVSLPYRSEADGIPVTRSSVGHMARAWYRVSYHVPAGWTTDDQLMIYSPRVAGVAWAARVNDQIVADNLDDWRMTRYRPIAVRLGSTQFRPGDRLDIAMEIAYEPQRGHGLAHISVGPAYALAQRLAIREFLQFIMPVACSVTLSAMGVFFLLFWWSRRAERAHLFLALSCIAWCVCNLQYVLPRRDDAVLNAWYSAVAGPSISWVMWLMYLFVLQLDGRFSRVIALLMPAFVLIMTFLALPFVPLNENMGTIYQGTNLAVAALIAARIGWMAIRGGNLELRVIAAALAVTILAGAHDVALLGQRIDHEGIYLLPYCSMLLFGSFLFAVQRRYVHAINEYDHLSSSLAQRLSERESELQANHSRLIELERAQTLAAERHRLMHDMHDGLGSALTTSLAMLEQGNLDAVELKGLLLDSVDDLRAVIDSLEPLDGDLTSVLATLRFRLGKRLELAGIGLVWDMQDLPTLSWLGPSQALQLMRIVQEVLTNVLRHARATRMQISAQCRELFIEVCITDNGCGFDTAITPTGRGLRHLPQRAASLNGSIMIDSRPGSGTTVRLLLPIAVRVSEERSS
jgi:signal transduction histidine kinase